MEQFFYSTGLFERLDSLRDWIASFLKEKRREDTWFRAASTGELL